MPSTPSQRPWYAYATTPAQAASPSAPSSSSKPKPRSSLRRTSAYNDFDEQSWLSSLTSSIKTALKRPRERERAHAREDVVDSPSMRSEPRKRRDRIVVVDEGVQTEAFEEDAAPSGKGAPSLFDVNRARGSPRQPPAAAGGDLAATELLALAGYADEGANGNGAEQGNVLDLQGVLSARQREEQQDDDGVPHIRPAAAAASAAPAMANASSSTSASDLFRQGVDIEDILRQRAAALLQQAGEEEDDDDDDDELDDEEEEEKDEDADMDTSPPRAGGLIQEIPGPDDDASGDASDEEEEEDEDDEDSSEEEDDSEDDRDDELPIEPVHDQHIRATSNTAASDDVIEIGSSSEEEEEDSNEQDDEDDDEEEEEDDEAEDEEEEALQDERDADLRSDDEEQDDASSPLYDPAVPLVSGPHPDLPPFDPLLAMSQGQYQEEEDEEEDEDDDGEEEADGWDEEAAQTFIPRQSLDVEDVDRPDVSIDEAETSSIEEGREEYEPEEDSNKQPNLDAMPIAVAAAVAAEQANEFAPPVPPPATSFISASELLPLRNVQDKPASSVASVASAGSASRQDGDRSTDAAPAPIEAIPTSAKELVDLKAQVEQPLASGPPSVAATEGSEGAAKEEEVAQEISTPPLPPTLPNTVGWPSAAAGSFSTSTPVGTPSLSAAAVIPPPLATPTKEHAPPPAQPQDGDALRELKSRTREIAREMGAPPSVGATVDSTEDAGKDVSGRREVDEEREEEREEDDERLATPPLASAVADGWGEHEKVESADAVAEEAAQEPLEAARAEDVDAGADDFDFDAGNGSVDVEIESTGSVLEEPEEGEPRAEADNFDAGNGSVDVEIESTGSVLEEPEEGEPRKQPEALEEEEVQEAKEPEAAVQPPIVAMDMDDLIDLPDDNEAGVEDDEAAVEEEEPKTKDDDIADEAAQLEEGAEEPTDAQENAAAARRPTGSPQGTQFSPRRRRGEPSSSQTEEPASPVPTSIRGMRKHLRSLAARQASEDTAAAQTLDTTATAPTGDSTMEVAGATGDSSFVPDSAGPSTTDSRPSSSGRRRFRHRHVHGSHAHAVDEPLHQDQEPDDSREEHQVEEERHLPTTRSHCGFEKLALNVGDADGKQRDMFLIVPQCSIRHDRLEQEQARALGRATKSENERKVEVESGLLDDEVYHRLARLIGHEMMEEAWLLEQEQEKEEANTSKQAVSPATAKGKGHRRHRSSGGGDRDWLPPDEERHKKHGNKSAEHPGLDADLSLDMLEEEQEHEEEEPTQTTETPIMPRRTPSRSAKQASIEPSSTSKVTKRRRSVAQGADESTAEDAAAETPATSSSSKRRRSASVKVEAPPAEADEDDGVMSVGPSTRSMRRKEAEAAEKSPEPMLTRSRSVQRK